MQILLFGSRYEGTDIGHLSTHIFVSGSAFKFALHYNAGTHVLFLDTSAYVLIGHLYTHKIFFLSVNILGFDGQVLTHFQVVLSLHKNVLF